MASASVKSMIEEFEKKIRIRFKDVKGIERSLSIEKGDADALRVGGRSPTSYVQEKYVELTNANPTLDMKQIRRRIIVSVKEVYARSVSLEDLDISALDDLGQDGKS